MQTSSSPPVQQPDQPLGGPPVLGANSALFLDFDGTMIELADTPDSVDVPQRVHNILRSVVTALRGRAAIVTGRGIDVIRGDFGVRGIAVAGSHGSEFANADEDAAALQNLPHLDAAKAALKNFAKDKPGVLVEDKPLGVGLHFRQAPEMSEKCEDIALKLIKTHDLVLQRGKMLFELRSDAASKSTAVHEFMSQPPFAAAPPIFVGDDVTDEDGFEAAETLGGYGILVGAQRATRARYRLENVDSVYAWLDRSLAAISNP